MIGSFPSEPVTAWKTDLRQVKRHMDRCCDPSKNEWQELCTLTANRDCDYLSSHTGHTDARQESPIGMGSKTLVCASPGGWVRVRLGGALIWQSVGVYSSGGGGRGLWQDRIQSSFPAIKLLITIDIKPTMQQKEMWHFSTGRQFHASGLWSNKQISPVVQH